VERGLFASHDPLEEISVGRYRIRRREFRPAKYSLQLVRDNACKCRHAGVVAPRHLLVMYGSRQPAPGRGLIVMCAAFSSHTKQ